MHHHHLAFNFGCRFVSHNYLCIPISNFYYENMLFFFKYNSSLLIISTSLIKNMSFCSKCWKINKGRMDRFKVSLVKLLLIKDLQFRSTFMPWATIIDKFHLYNAIILNSGLRKIAMELADLVMNFNWEKMAHRFPEERFLFFILLWSATSR